jgi:uncharacterized RDD family membrane protein YckC
MSALERIYNQLPRPKIWRRGVATGLDFFVAWLLSALAYNTQATVQYWQISIFVIVWFGLRVAMPARNQGQSLGRWAFDLKLVDSRGRGPGLLELGKREGVLGAEALLAIVAGSNLNAGLAILMLLLPLGIDCGMAGTNARRQALHDYLGRTTVIHTLRGFSLDRKIKKMLAKNQQRMR